MHVYRSMYACVQVIKCMCTGQYMHVYRSCMCTGQYIHVYRSCMCTGHYMHVYRALNACVQVMYMNSNSTIHPWLVCVIVQSDTSIMLRSV